METVQLEKRAETVPANRGPKEWKEFEVSERKEIIREVESIQASEDLSNKVIGHFLGCSSAVWSQIRAGTYPGKTDKYLAAAKQWLKDRGDRTESPETEYVETTISRRILAVCQHAWEMPTIGLIVTPSGCGKTAALLEFARERGKTAIYISVGEWFNAKFGLLRELARHLGIAPKSSQTIETLGDEVRKNLAALYNGGVGTPMTLIVDEATGLKPNALNLLRNFHDDPACRCPVILADTWRLDAALRSPHGIAGGNEQLRTRGRACYAFRLDEKVPEADVRAVAESVVRGLGHRGGLPRESIRFLAGDGVGQADGRLRNVVARLHACYRIADKLGAEPIFDVAQLDYVAELVGSKCELKHESPPFGVRRAASKPATAVA